MPGRSSRRPAPAGSFPTLLRSKPQTTRSTFLGTEFHAGDYRSWAGWTGHRLRRNGDGWEFLVKQVNLINYDQNLRNPSITL